MNKNQVARISMIIIVLIFLGLFISYKIGFSLSIKKEADNLFVNPSEIKWVRIIGGLDINTKVLFAGHDDEIINRLIKMINNGEKLGVASNLYAKGRPLGIQVKENNGEDIVIWQLYESFSSGNGASISNEKVILDKYENGIEHFYIIKSKSIANFFFYELQKVMPIVNRISATKSSSGNCAKEGDRIKISGDGCTEGKVCIYISPNAHQHTKYLVAKVPSVFGKWSWSSVIKKKMKTLDGAVFNIGNGYYDIVAEMGSSGTRLSGFINFDKNK